MDSRNETHDILLEWIKKESASADKGPRECFDRRPLSNMLVAADPFDRNKHIKILDNFRPDWLKDGVQVPSGKPLIQRPEPRKAELPILKRKNNISILPEKLVRCARDQLYNPELHHVSKKGLVAPPVYNIDDIDHSWICVSNEDRIHKNLEKIQDWMLEDVIEAAEHISFVNGASADDDAKCDICQSYDGEDGNELVFCEACNVCVHQACYGIVSLPEGPWFCKRCEMGVNADVPCELCPIRGGAMKLMEDDMTWCHVSCGLWTPELSFLDAELMEPICGLAEVPQARRHLLCMFCKIHHGAPIQCSVKKCKVAFHVTCAFQHNMVMLQLLNGSEVKLLGHCPKHSSKEYQERLALLRSSSKGNSIHLHTTDTNGSSMMSDVSPAKPLSIPERLENGTQTFHTHVTRDSVVDLLNRWLLQRTAKRHGASALSPPTQSEATLRIPLEVIDQILAYWRLKRRAYNFNRPLVAHPPPHWYSESQKDESVPANCTRSNEPEGPGFEENSLLNRKSGVEKARRRRRKKIVDIKMENPTVTSEDTPVPHPYLDNQAFEIPPTEQDDFEVVDLTPHAAPATNVQTKQRENFIVTGNPVVDEISTKQLVIDPIILSRLRASFGRKRGRPRVRPSTVVANRLREMNMAHGIQDGSPVSFQRRERPPRKALKSVDSNDLDSAPSSMMDTESLPNIEYEDEKTITESSSGEKFC